MYFLGTDQRVATTMSRFPIICPVPHPRDAFTSSHPVLSCLLPCHVCRSLDSQLACLECYLLCSIPYLPVVP